MRFTHVYFAFAAGYLLSYLFRMINAVISPDLARDLDLAPSSLGMLTSAYLFAFGVLQLPVGILLDRYGPRRVEPALFVVAAAGAVLFASAQSLATLTLARALIGAGVCAALMGPLKAMAAWYPADRQTSYAGWMMVSGGVGALLATVPLDLALQVTSWRGVFVALSVACLVTAVAIYVRVPDIAAPAKAASLPAQVAGLRAIFAEPRFWWIAPLGALAMGSFMAIQGLWAVPWLMEVDGFSRAQAASHLLAMSAVQLVGYVGIGSLGSALARRGIHARHLFGGGFALNFVALLLIVLQVPGSYVWWGLFGFGAAGNILGFTALNEGFGRDLAGRVSSSLNLVMFAGSFSVQWGIGLVADAVRAGSGASVADGLRVAFALVMLLYAATFVWFLRGFRRHGEVRPAFAS